MYNIAVKFKLKNRIIIIIFNIKIKEIIYVKKKHSIINTCIFQKYFSFYIINVLSRNSYVIINILIFFRRKINILTIIILKY